ncbi:MAG: zinc metallopeptidase [Pseudomonadota bacterium]
MAIAIIAILIFVALAFLPSFWVRRVIETHGGHRADFPGTGGEFARHLLDEMKLTNVAVEETNMGDHYDPQAKTVRLLPQHYTGKSLSAVVIAAHEVGHAMQDATQYPPLSARSRMAKMSGTIQSVGMVVMLAAPVMVLLTKSPAMALLNVAGGVMIMGFTVLIHAVTLPVEFDASFKRALPVLKAGNYISEHDMKNARQILWAAALTYVAAAGMSLIDIARWIRFLRF